MSLIIIGVNHKTAHITLREKIYFAPEKITFYLQDIIEKNIAREAVLMSTCNRSELYCEADDIEALQAWFCAQTTLSADILLPAIYMHCDQAAIAHIMQVACGLDSMVLGEPQILGQMKTAFSESCAAGAVGSYFHRLFRYVFTLAKTIRTTTSIGACPVSIASAAVHFAKQKQSTFIAANFSAAHITLIGAGETAELLMRYLTAQAVTALTLINRNIEHARTLMKNTRGCVLGLDQLTTALTTADIVFSATGSATPIITKELVEEIMCARAHRPLMLIDIAVPRDIDPAVANIENIQLYCIDDLMAMIAQHRQGREHAADQARALITQKSADCLAELNSMTAVADMIRAYRSQIEKICYDELIKAQQQLSQGADPIQTLNEFARAYTNKILHTPSSQLRQAGVEGRMEWLTVAKQLFAIHEVEMKVKSS